MKLRHSCSVKTKVRPQLKWPEEFQRARGDGILVRSQHGVLSLKVQQQTQRTHFNVGLVIISLYCCPVSLLQLTVVWLPTAAAFQAVASSKGCGSSSHRIKTNDVTSRLSGLLFGTESSESIEERFRRSARLPSDENKDSPRCILTIDGVEYNLTTWIDQHPGGSTVLLKWHEKGNATSAFEAAGYSQAARTLLNSFSVKRATDPSSLQPVVAFKRKKNLSEWKDKLFTQEDPIGLHKTLGIICLLHFMFRFYQMLWGDASCGLGNRLGKGPSIKPTWFLLPHFLLSVSSLIFHSVPRERVVGRPMIWQEFRWHNILFGVRSVLTSLLAWWSIYNQHRSPIRKLAVGGSCLVTLASMRLADFVTKHRKPSPHESTTATMPYWEECSLETQKRFKRFYAFSQFQATATCFAVGNPAWTLSILLPIQGASFFMTLVRKGLVSTRGYHVAYTITLLLPYLVGLRSMLYMQNIDFPLFLLASALLFQLRGRGVNKYALWIPFALGRFFCGDAILHYDRPW